MVANRTPVRSGRLKYQAAPLGDATIKVYLLAISCLILAMAPPRHLAAQEIDPNRLQAFGLRLLEGKHIRLITDLPLDEEIQALPALFDQAVPQWLAYFQQTDRDPSTWQAIAMIMQDRERFRQAGLLTPDIPDFRDGYQATDRVFLMEQPSPYYRRHLLIHEGTHWIMWKLFGSAGPTWYMEGVAELLGTHSWSNHQLTIGIMPTSNDEVPYWGRLKLIRDQIQRGDAPSLDTILRTPGSPRAPVENYAWNWATVRFLTAHPTYGTPIREYLLKTIPNQPTDQVQRGLLKDFQNHWPILRREFACYIQDLEYGFDFEHALPSPLLNPDPSVPSPPTCNVQANAGWQSSGWWLQSGQQISLQADGSAQIADDQDPLIAEPQGLSLDYVHGFPWGRLLAAIIPEDSSEPAHTQPLSILDIGRGGDFPTSAGLLVFKINDHPSQLRDNSGHYTVKIQLAKP